VGAANHDLLNQAASGDEQALADLLQQHTPTVRRQLAGKIPRRWQSVLAMDDVLQQTCVDVFLNMDQFDPRGEASFTTWLVALAKHNLTDALRMLEADKRGKDCWRAQPEAGEDSFVALYELLGDTRSTPSRHVARDEACAALKCAIEQLPETYRRVVQMYDIEGRAVEEVARAFERSPGAVYMIRARAHRRLGVFLGSASKYFSSA
jgi:RNA polymerase sigma-70 factor (ECF subfamily)